MRQTTVVVLLSMSLLLPYTPLQAYTPAQARKGDTTRLIDLGAFCVATPAPKRSMQEAPPVKWEKTIGERNGLKTITFTKVSRTPQGVFKHADMILVSQNRTLESAWDKSKRDFADIVIDGEINVMTKKGVNKGIYELREVTRSDTEVAGLKLYSMSYVKWIGGSAGTNTESGLLSVYFPERYEQDHVFYMFFATHFNTVSGGKFFIDRAAFNGVLESFKLQN